MFFKRFKEKYSRQISLDYFYLGGMKGILRCQKGVISFNLLLYILFSLQIIGFMSSAIYTATIIKSDLFYMIDVTIAAIPTFFVYLKSLVFVYYASTINRSLTLFDLDFMKLITKSEPLKQTFLRSIQFANRVSLIFFVAVTPTILFWWTRPLTMGLTVFNSNNGASEQVFKPLDILYPFDFTVQPIHLMVILFEFLGVSAVVLIMISIGSYVCTLICALWGHIDVIAHAIRLLQHESVNCHENDYKQRDDTSETEILDDDDHIILNTFNPDTDMEFQLNRYRATSDSKEDIYERLKIIIQDHQKLVAMFEDLKKVFSPIMAIDFASTSLSLCIIVFKVTKAGYLNAMQTTRDLHYIVTMFGQMLIFPWFGSMLKYKSINLNWDILRCDWSRGSSKFRNAVTMMLIRAQQPMCFKIFGVMDVDLAAFEFSVRLVYSYYTMLRVISE